MILFIMLLILLHPHNNLQATISHHQLQPTVQIQQIQGSSPVLQGSQTYNIQG